MPCDVALLAVDEISGCVAFGVAILTVQSILFLPLQSVFLVVSWVDLPPFGGVFAEAGQVSQGALVPEAREGCFGMHEGYALAEGCHASDLAVHDAVALGVVAEDGADFVLEYAVTLGKER